LQQANTSLPHHKQCLLLFYSLKLNPQFSQTLQPTSHQTFFLLHSPQTLSSRTSLFQMVHSLSIFTPITFRPQTPHSLPPTLFSSSQQQCCTKFLSQISPFQPLKQPPMDKTVLSHPTVTSVSLWTSQVPTSGSFLSEEALS